MRPGCAPEIPDRVRDDKWEGLPRPTPVMLNLFQHLPNLAREPVWPRAAFTRYRVKVDMPKMMNSIITPAYRNLKQLDHILQLGNRPGQALL